MYAGGQGRMYVSRPAGSGWQAITVPAPEGDVEDMISFQGKLYLAVYRHGIMESNDGGRSWQLMQRGAGIFPVAFAVSGGRLHVATGDQGIFQFDHGNGRWLPFNEGLYDRIESAFDCFTTAEGTLLGGISANGGVAVRHASDLKWSVAYPAGRISPGATIFDILYASGRLWAITSIGIFQSDNRGQAWARAATGIIAGIDGQACAANDTIYLVINSKRGAATVYKRPADSPAETAWVAVDAIEGIYVYALAYFEGKIYMATQKGLFSSVIKAEQPKNPAESKPLIYPNPATEHLTISKSGSLFQLYRADGRLTLSETVDSESRQIDISPLKAGSYVYRLQLGNGHSHTGRLIIQ